MSNAGKWDILQLCIIENYKVEPVNLVVSQENAIQMERQGIKPRIVLKVSQKGKQRRHINTAIQVGPKSQSN